MKTILVLLDFDEMENHVAEYAYKMAEDFGADLLLFNSLDTPEAFFLERRSVWEEEHLEAYKAASYKKLNSVKEHLLKRFEIKDSSTKPGIMLESGLKSFGDNLIDIREKKDILLTLMGKNFKKSSVLNLFYESRSDYVLRKARFPVLFIPHNAAYKAFKKIGLAVAEFCESEKNALSYLFNLTSCLPIELVVFHISAINGNDVAYDSVLRGFNELSKIKNSEHTSLQIIHDIRTAESITEFSNQNNFSVLAMVKRQHPFYKQLIHRSRINKVLKQSSSPLLVIPQYIPNQPIRTLPNYMSVWSRAVFSAHSFSCNKHQISPVSRLGAEVYFHLQHIYFRQQSLSNFRF